MTTWDARKTIGAVAVAVAIAGVGGAAVAAATDTGFHAVSGGMHDFGGGPPGPPPAHRTDDDPAPASLHGEYVVADGHGGFTTMLSQTGRIMAISATSVTARSDDGFVQSYVIHEVGGAAAPPFTVNEQVIIDATREGGTATVTAMRPPLAPRH